MSISGFSGAFSRLLERSLAARSASSGISEGRHVAPRGLYGSLTHGLYGLAGGVSSGVTGVVYAPYQGAPPATIAGNSSLTCTFVFRVFFSLVA